MSGFSKGKLIESGSEKMKLNNEKLAQFLTVMDPSIAKQNLWIVLLVFNPLCLLVGATEPHIWSIIAVVIACLAILDVFTIYMLFVYRQKRILIVLYGGIFCLITSFIFLVVFYKTVYFEIGVSSAYPFIISTFVYLLLPIVETMFIMRWLMQEGNLKQKGYKKRAGLIGLMSGAGILIGNILIRVASERTGLIVWTLCLLLFSYLLETGVPNIYKYYLLTKYEEYSR